MSSPTKKPERPFRFAVSKLDVAKTITTALFELPELITDDNDQYERDFCLRLSRKSKFILIEMKRLAKLIIEFYVVRGFYPDSTLMPEVEQLKKYMVVANMFKFCEPCNNRLPAKWKGRNYRCDNCGSVVGRKR